MYFLLFCCFMKFFWGCIKLELKFEWIVKVIDIILCYIFEMDKDVFGKNYLCIFENLVLCYLFCGKFWLVGIVKLKIKRNVKIIFLVCCWKNIW